MKGDSIRLRLTQPEVARLHEHGAVQETCHFSDGGEFTWLVRSDEAPLSASFDAERITVTLPVKSVAKWANGDEIGIYGNAGALSISVEKDFRCVTRRDDDDAGAFPNPATRC